VKSFDCNLPKHEFLKSMQPSELTDRVKQERLASGKSPIEES